MAKKFKDFVGHEATFHKTSIGRTPSKCKMNKSKRRYKTSIGRTPSKCKMNKSKRRSWKKYRGQGK
jgi:hypothetical protein